MKLKTTEEFINDSKKIHGNKYDYSKVVYKGSKSKVCIICPIHGEFWQTPNNHLHLRGCPKCAKITMSNKFIKQNEQFILEANHKHNNKYDYSKIEYKGAHKK